MNIVFLNCILDKKHRNADINTKRYKVKRNFLIAKQFIIKKSDLFSVNRNEKSLTFENQAFELNCFIRTIGFIEPQLYRQA